MSWILTGEWKKCPFPCVIAVPFKDVRGNRGAHQHASADRRRVRSVTPVAGSLHQCGSPAAGNPNTGNRNIVAKQKSSQISQESQLKLNCESGITLYIKKKKEKKQTILLSISSRCFLPLFLIYDLVWEIRFLLQVFYFFSVHVNCLAKKKKRKQTENTLKGLCICLIHLEFYFLIT